MPFRRELYPLDWPAISVEVREVAGGRCEFCGAVNYAAHPVTGSRVVLTVAHLDHDPMNCARENLRALCQRCHLAYDLKMHLARAAETRRRKRRARGQMEMWVEGGGR